MSVVPASQKPEGWRAWIVDPPTIQLIESGRLRPPSRPPFTPAEYADLPRPAPLPAGAAPADEWVDWDRGSDERGQP